MKLRHLRIGFTLIELMVVIAIIAVLSGILLPVIVTAKRASYQSVCASNLGQIYKACRMYSDDWGGRLPLPGGIDDPRVWMETAGKGSVVQTGAIYPYLRAQLRTGTRNNLWSCPLAVRVTNSGNYSPGQGYIMNDYLRLEHPGEFNNPLSSPGWYWGFPIDSCPRPSQVIMFYEGVQDRDGYCSRHGSNFYINSNRYPFVNKAFTQLRFPNIAQNWHGGKSNFLFLDGHVHLMAPQYTWSKATYDQYGKYGDFQWWLQIYGGYGPADLWNPNVPNVVYP